MPARRTRKASHQPSPAQLNAALLDALEIDALLPPSLAGWRPQIVEALIHFLDLLPPQRMSEIILRQFALGEDATPAARMVALLSQCPTLHKLGQVLARNQQLDRGLRGHLQALESMPSTADVTSLEPVIRGQIRLPAALALGQAPLAEGSVAVVLPFCWREGGRLRDGVFKVLKPGIEQRLAEELAILPGLAGMLERRGRQRGLPTVDYRGTLKSVRRLLTQELRLDREQVNMRRAAAFHADEADLFVPPLLPWCSPRVTAMAQVMGGSLSTASLPAAKAGALADTLIRALLAKPFWTRSEKAIFHGDLHGGNLLLDADGRIAVIDWSLTASLAKPQREALVAIALGGLTCDERQICNALAALGGQEATGAGLRDAVGRSLDRLVLSGRPIGFDWLVGMLDDVALQGRTGFGEQLTVLRKSWLSLSGVVRDLHGDVPADLPLLGTGLQQFAAELPQRLLARPDCRDFSTHVSNADLARLAASAWPTCSRYWLRWLANAFAVAGGPGQPDDPSQVEAC